MKKELLKLFFKQFGRKPKDQLEWLQWRFKNSQQSGKGQILRPDFGKKNPWYKGEGEVIDTSFRPDKKVNMSNEDYSSLKDEWFTKIIANTDDALNTFLKRGIDKADKRFSNLTQNQRKDFLNMVEYRLKHGNKKFMNDFTDAKGEFKLPEDLAGGGIAGMLGEPTYQDDSHRVPYGGGGAGKPPVTFTLQGGGSYGSNKIGPGLDLTQSGYGFDLGTEIGLPWGFSATGGVGIGRGKTEVDYNDQNVFSGVDETKLGDKWNVGLKWSKKFNEGGRVPYKNAKLVDPGYFMYQEPAEDRPSRYEYNPGDSRVKREMERLKKELIEAGIIERKIFSEADRMPASNPYFLEFMEEENLGTGAGEATPEEYEEQEKVLRSKQEVKDGGRVPFSGGKGVLKGLAKLMDEFFPGTTKLGQTSKPMAEKTQLRKAIADFQNREKHKTLLDDFNKKYTVEQEKKISSEQVGSLDEFHADFVKETGINIPKENLKQAWDIKKSYPFNTPIIDKNGKFIGQEATQQMYPKSKKFIVKDEDQLTKEIDLKREGRRPSGERAGIDVPPVPGGFKLSREKLIDNFPEISLDEIDEVMKLDKETQARYIMMLKNRRLDPDLYDELLLKHGDTLDFQGEFDKAIRRKKNATGGIVDGRVGLLWGGGIYKTIIKNLAKERGVNPSTYLKYTNYKALPEDVQKYIPKDEFEKLKKSRIDMFENFVEMAKTRKDFLKHTEQGKKNEFMAPFYKDMEKSFGKSPVPSSVTDKDILQGEYILKNLKTKGRKLNATGGRVSLSNGGVAGMLGE
jgi:hypothetical protein